MGKYLIGIDEGTTGCKTCIFEFDGTLVGSDYREYPCYYPKSGWVEQYGDEITSGLFASCNSAINKAKIDPKEIEAVALSTQGSVWGPLDKDGVLIRAFMGWQDTRGAAYVDRMMKGEYIDPAELYQIAGYGPATVPALTKYLWFKDNEPELFAKTEYFASHQEYFLQRFGADDWFVTDTASASRTGVFDIDNNCWSEKIIVDALGLDINKFPKIVKAGTVVGTINKHIAEMTGLAEGTKLCVGAMDQNCSTMGGGLVKGGSAVAVIGTYGSTYVAMDESVRDPNRTLIFKHNSGPENYTFEAASIASASSYRWYRDVFCDLEVAAGKVVGTDPYELINQQIDKVAPGANGISFLPYLQGAGSGPRSDNYARGCILNANLGTTKAEIARAVMEGITFEMRDNIDSIRRIGIELKDLRITGGGTKTPIWCQMQADIYKQTVSVLQTSETGCLGAAIYAGVGAGVYKDYEDAANKAVRIKEVYTPNPDNYEAYDRAYKRYVTAYESLANGGYFAMNKED
mgnify:CR=1 FL=1